jgi:hypothetical protein
LTEEERRYLRILALDRNGWWYRLRALFRVDDTRTARQLYRAERLFWHYRDLLIEHREPEWMTFEGRDLPKPRISHRLASVRNYGSLGGPVVLKGVIF